MTTVEAAKGSFHVILCNFKQIQFKEHYAMRKNLKIIYTARNFSTPFRQNMVKN